MKVLWIFASLAGTGAFYWQARDLRRRASFQTRKGRYNFLVPASCFPKIDSDFRADASQAVMADLLTDVCIEVIHPEKIEEI